MKAQDFPADCAILNPKCKNPYNYKVQKQQETGLVQYCIFPMKENQTK